MYTHNIYIYIYICTRTHTHTLITIVNEHVAVSFALVLLSCLFGLWAVRKGNPRYARWCIYIYIYIYIYYV